MKQDEAHSALEEHYDRLAGSVKWVFEEKYRKKYPGRTIHRRGTRANIVNDEILAKVIEEFDGVSDVRPVEIRGKNLRFLRVGDILLWFKKTDALRRPRIYPTKHAELLEGGKQLTMYPRCEILVVGYLLNADETKVKRVSISKPAGRGRKPEWYIDLEFPAENLVVFSGHGENGDSGSTRSRVIVKRGAVQDELIG